MQNSLFGLQNRYARLSEAGDPLERLNAVIDWEMFRPILSRIDPTERKSATGRKPTCRVLMFKMLDVVLRDEVTGGKEVWADSAYRSDEQEQSLKGSRHESQIHERAYCNKPLTEAQALGNTEKSRVRARVEHVFGVMENDMGGIFLCSIGAARVKVGVSLMNLTYNLKRIETLIRLKVFDFDRIGAPVAQAIALKGWMTTQNSRHWLGKMNKPP